MNKLFMSIVMVSTLLLVSACTANIDQSSNQDNTSELVEVDIFIPEEISLNQESVLKVHLTQGKENVEDADDVQFEIWKANSKEKSELIEATHEEGGIYSVKKAFQENGIYFVQPHVTARDLHVMPKKQFIVGNVSEEELNLLKEEPQNQENSNDHGHHH